MLMREKQSQVTKTIFKLRVGPVLIAAICLLASSLLMVGCGTDSKQTDDSKPSDGAISPTTVTSLFDTGTEEEQSDLDITTSTTLHEEAPEANASEEVMALFAALATQMDPIPVYVPTYLPGGAVLAEKGWPSIASDTLLGPSPLELTNPQVDRDEVGNPVTSQVLFSIGDGYLAVIANLRGDLGDVPNNKICEIEGNPVSLYSQGDDHIIQWSDSDMWNVLMAKGISADELLKIALGLERIMP